MGQETFSHISVHIGFPGEGYQVYIITDRCIINDTFRNKLSNFRIINSCKCFIRVINSRVLVENEKLSSP